MKYLEYSDITDEQEEILSKLLDSQLAVYDKYGFQVDYGIVDCKIDENGVIYAPTKVEEYDNSDYSDNVPGGVRYETRVDFTEYKPIFQIMKEGAEFKI